MTYITEQVQELGTILEHAMDENFQEELDRLAAETFDLVSMDCGMPTHSTSLRE